MNNLSYEDVYLVPNKCTVVSRAYCDTSIKFGPEKFTVPVCPANMPSVISQETCLFLAKIGLFYIMHRFNLHYINFFDFMQKNDQYVSISTGINDLSALKGLAATDRYPEYITIDVANAWSTHAMYTAEVIRKLFPNTFLIIGNIATPEAVKDIEKQGVVNALKCGISRGMACTTRNKTGFGLEMFSSVLECAKLAHLPIVADGGVKQPGDVAKALVAGASMVMCGQLFAGYLESGGSIKTDPNTREKYKLYYGNASAENDKEGRIEGTTVKMDYKGPMIPFLQDLRESLQSSISYAGGTDLTAFRNVAWKF